MADRNSSSTSLAQLAASPQSGLAHRTAQQVIEMFAALNLPVTDDGNAIESEANRQRARRLRELASPDPAVRAKASEWMRHLELLKNHRQELLNIVHNFFVQLADAVCVGRPELTVEVIDYLQQLAQEQCCFDDALTRRVVDEYQARQLPDVVRARRDEAQVLADAKYKVRNAFRHDSADFFIGDCNEGKTYYERGCYRLESFNQPNNYLSSRSILLGRYTQFVLEVVVSKAQGSDESNFGVQFGDQWPGNTHEFLLNDSGRLQVTKHLNVGGGHNWTTLSEINSSPIVKGENGTNRLKIVRWENFFHVCVNGQHAVTVNDSSIQSGIFGFVLGPDLHVSFSKLKISGCLDVDWLYQVAMRHFHNWEAKEGRQLLRLIVEQDPTYRDTMELLHRETSDCKGLLDYRETVLIIVGAEILPQLHDGRAAFQLIEAINKSGRGSVNRWAGQITDTGYLHLTDGKRCGIIAIGGPASNAVTAQLKDHLPMDPISNQKVFVQHNIGSGDRRCVLWGSGAKETMEAVNRFIESGLLDKFLNILWGDDSLRGRFRALWS
ncbi:MAG: hypothetical protein HYZ50_20255 [Deltaproteobacteria bacterium]|nr:hypothetical protein [Deltaproteobacteria bacterium]